MDEDKKDEIKENPNTDAEKKFALTIDDWQTNAEGGKRADIEDKWYDEYLAFKGDQWDTSIAPRSSESKSYRPNSVNNYILPTIKNIHDSLTTSMPEGVFEGREGQDDETADKLNDLVPFILDKNKYRKQWKDTVLQGLKYGPFIGAVLWDSQWMGGSGPHRWVGDIRILNQKKDEIFFDPAIIDLEERLQECSYINRKFRKKLSYIIDRWDETGKAVTEDCAISKNETVNEGLDPEQAYVIECWHKGVPRFVPKYWKERFLEKAEKNRAKGLTYKAEEYEDKAKGTFKGVHVAYKAGNILLEYIPYVYDDGLYPFVYKVLYADEFNPYGFGEIRNILNPQILLNRADEIQIEAMDCEGLGGYFYDKGSISEAQKREYIKNAHRGGVMQEVNNAGGMKKREGTQTPQSLLLFLDKKKTVIDTVSQNTAIAQGVSPGANVPYSSIAELGARSDVRNKGKIEILEDFLDEMFQLVINRIAQFYDDEREYRIRGNKSSAIKTLVYDAIEQITKMQDQQQQLEAMAQIVSTIQTMQTDETMKFGTFQNSEMVREHTRKEGKEEYIPEFDIKVKVVDERPTSRKYYEQLAMSLFGKGMGPKAFWKTIEDGKLPPVDEILQELQEMQTQQAQTELGSDAIKNVQQAPPM